MRIRKPDATGIINPMRDGLYQVTTSYLCAGFIVKGGKVVWCAPILRKRIEYWKTVAKLLKGEGNED